VGQGRDGTTFYIDTSTIQSQPDGSIKIWTKREKKPGSKYSHEKILISFNCQQLTSKYEAAISYLNDGTVGNDNYKPEKRFLPVPPDTADWITMKKACAFNSLSKN